MAQAQSSETLQNPSLEFSKYSITFRETSRRCFQLIPTILVNENFPCKSLSQVIAKMHTIFCKKQKAASFYKMTNFAVFV